MKNKRLRFVLLEHQRNTNDIHFDLLLEEEINCKTFRLNENIFKTLKSQGEEIPPHRKHYLKFEGAIEKNRGSVRRINEGSYSTLEQNKNSSSWQLFLNTSSGNLMITWKVDSQILATWNPASSNSS